jgi:hypothetical protein
MAYEIPHPPASSIQNDCWWHNTGPAIKGVAQGVWVSSAQLAAILQSIFNSDENYD